MQLSFDAADRLVELVEARHGPVPATDAARALFALASAPTAIARSLLDEVVSGDARLQWRGASVGLADPPGAATALETAAFVVFDLETTGLSPRGSRIVEIGAQRVEALECRDTFETLVNPGVPVPAAITALTGIGQETSTERPRQDLAVRRFLAFSGEAVLVAHNARFDMAFLDHAVLRLTGRRVAAPGGRHGLARATAARGADEALRARAPVPLLRDVGRAVPPGAPGRRSHGRDPDRADRARPGARRRDGRRSRRPLRAARPEAARQAQPRRGSSPRRRDLRLSRRPRSAAVRGAGTRPLRPSSLVLLRRAAAARGRGGARRARAGRVAALRERARGGPRRAAPAARAPAAGERPRHEAGPCMSISVAAARAGCAGASRRRTGRFPAGRSPAAPRGRWTGSRATIRAMRSRACARACGGSRRISASRMPRGCATGSPRSSGSQSGWTSSRAPAPCAPVSSCRRSIPA